MIRRPPRSTRTDTLFPYTTLSDLPYAQPHRQRGGIRLPAQKAARLAPPQCQHHSGDPDMSHSSHAPQDGKTMKQTLFIGEYASRNVGDGIIKLTIDRKSTRLNSSH